jgi:hypothetical protein
MSDVQMSAGAHSSEGITARPIPLSAPIFLTGFARSGTTWVNRVLGGYFDLGYVNEGQFIVTFARRIGRYGDLRDARGRKWLLRDLRGDDFFAVLARNYPVEIDWTRVEDNATSFPMVVKDILSQIAEQTGKRRIGSKNPAFGYHLDLVNQIFPDCRVIHVVRDGRDCALSHKRMRWGQQNVYCAAVRWRKYLTAARAAAVNMGDRYIEFRYEDLLLDPESTISRLERFITGSPDRSVTDRFMGEAGSLKTNKVGTWRESMPLREQAIFEGVAGDML